jgi:hypothetical protein
MLYTSPWSRFKLTTSVVINCIGGLMVRLLALSVVECGFKSQWVKPVPMGQASPDGSSQSRWVKPKTIKLVLAISHLKTLNWGIRAKIGCLGNRIVCPSEVTCVYVNCCFNELTLWKCWSSTKWTSSSSHWNVTCSHHDEADTLLTWC